MSTFTSLFDYATRGVPFEVAHTRKTHPKTSRDAATKAATRAKRDGDAACERLALHPEGLTGDAFPEHERKRLAGLADCDRPRVVRDGTRLNAAGNSSTVWKLAEAGH